MLKIEDLEIPLSVETTNASGTVGMRTAYPLFEEYHGVDIDN